MLLEMTDQIDPLYSERKSERLADDLRTFYSLFCQNPVSLENKSHRFPEIPASLFKSVPLRVCPR